MSKQGATSANMKPCNCANAELHCSPDRRDKLNYVRHDLTHQNVHWHRYDDRPLTQCFDDACKEYTKATGQKPQLGKVYRFDKSTNRKRVIDGFAPIREMVVVIKPETSEADIDRLCKDMQSHFGMTPLAYSIHRDEGHWSHEVDDQGEVSKVWIPNYHAHLFFDVMERRLTDSKGNTIPEKRRGRTIKFTTAQYSMMQDITAEALGMERGESGSKRIHQTQIEFKKAAQAKAIADATKRLNEIKAETEVASQHLSSLQSESERIDSENAVKRVKYEKKEKEMIDGVNKILLQKMKEVEDMGKLVDEDYKRNERKLREYDAMAEMLTQYQGLERTQGWRESMIERFVAFGVSLREQWNALFDGERVVTSRILLNGESVPLDNPVTLKLDKDKQLLIYDTLWVSEDGFWNKVKKGVSKALKKGGEAWTWVMVQLGKANGRHM